MREAQGGAELVSTETASLRINGGMGLGKFLLLLSLCLLVREVPATSLEDLAARKFPLVYCLKTQLKSHKRFGTGVQIVSGRLLTVWHEIEGGSSIEAFSHDGLRSPAKLLAKDVINDLALLAIAPRAGTVFLNEVPPSQGDGVFAIGCPRGTRHTLYRGTVREPGRILQGSRLIEIAMSIAHGDSGAPLFDMQGRLAGLVRGYLDGENDVSYAIPAAIVVQFLSQADLPVNELLDYREIRRLIAQDEGEAETLLKSLITGTQKDFRPFLLLALLHFKRRDYDGALRWYLGAAERAPRQYEIYDGLCQTYRMLGDTVTARRSCAYAHQLRGSTSE